MTELDGIFNDIKPIDLTPKPKGASKMSFWKLLGQACVAGAIFAATIWGTGFYHEYKNNKNVIQTDEAKAADKKKLANQTPAFSEAEERDLSRAKKYCWSWLPWERDIPTCKVWLRHYRQLGTYSDSDLFKEETEMAANTYFNDMGIVRDLGNEQSPTSEIH